MYRIRHELEELERNFNLRTIPKPERRSDLLDFSTNDYLGLGIDQELRNEFFSAPERRNLPLTSSASRLLASEQDRYSSLENLLSALYGRPALLFNSGYHANTGLVSALGDKDTLIVADKLVHASIIDGYKLSSAEMQRFRHNDCAHLKAILEAKSKSFKRVLIIVESVYSMDGDTAPLTEIAAIKRCYDNALLYVDEAHAFGVCGERGLGLVADSECAGDVDVIVGTFGKAAASQGAFAIMDGDLKNYAINRARSFIFSTAIPPLNCAWTQFVVEPAMSARREHLKALSARLHEKLRDLSPHFRASVSQASHIVPVIVGDSEKVIDYSRRLLEDGTKVLPIRTPTVPPHTELLRISLSAAMSEAAIDWLAASISRLL